MITLEKILQEHKGELKHLYGVKGIGIFGYYVRNEQKKGSDLDIVVKFERETNLFEFIELKEFLQKILKKKVDLVMINALKKRIKKQIMKEIVYV